MTDIDSYFTKNFYSLDSDYIHTLNNHDSGPINNVIIGFEENCYGVQIFDDKEVLEYSFFFISNKNELSGLGLDLSLNLDVVTRTKYTIELARQICIRYPETDIVDTFNTLQNNARSTFEKYGFLTIGNEIESMFKGKNISIIASGKKGIIKFPTMDKLNLYRWFFNENENFIEVDNSRRKKVYLLLDSSNNLIKIGQSINPSLREKTLHGISPEWDLITTWIAPVSVEKELHKKFASKHKRGEWFDLTFSDLKEIKDYMKKYINSL